MENSDQRRGVRILSLDGGGVKGLSELMVLELLMKSINPSSPPKPCDIFDLIGGTSTGGLIAIMLGRLRMTVADAIDAYLELSRKVFAPKHKVNFLATLANLSQAKGMCDSSALKNYIKATVKTALGVDEENALLLEGRQEAATRMFVCSIRQDLRSLICFRNYHADDEMDLEPKIWEAARATSAASTFFDPIEIGKYKQRFVDGGGGYNNPVQVAFDEARMCFPTRDIQCLVSIGAGKAEVAGFGRNLKQVGQTIIAIATDTDNTATSFANNHPELGFDTDQQKLFRFQVEHGMENVGMAEHDKISEIAAATQVYMQKKDEAGAKQLQKFKALMADAKPLEPEIESSSVEVDTAKILYIEKYSKDLEIKVMKHLPFRKPDYKTAEIKLAKKVFCSPDSHQILLSAGSLYEGNGPVWNVLLFRYSKIRDFGKPETERWETMPLQTAPWSSEGGFAAELPVTELWRLISSYPREAVHRGWYTPGQKGDPSYIYVGDLLISVPDTLQGKPLIHIELLDVSKIKFTGAGLRTIPSEDVAKAMCGGLGLPPYKRYSSDAEGWTVVPLPFALAFTALDVPNRCLFYEHYSWAGDQLGCLLKVCSYLWDHAASIDCTTEGVPLKILLEELQLKFDSVGPQWFCTLEDYQMSPLQGAMANTIYNGPAFNEEGQFVEVEDAIQLLSEADKYTANDTAFWDEDGMNCVVDTWWGRFGADRARWISLDMLLTLIVNLRKSVPLPPSCDALLHSASGNCFVV